jgi:hypothetical protein
MKKAIYPIFVTFAGILIIILCPIEEWKEYVMFGLVFFALAVNRIEIDELLNKKCFYEKNESKNKPYTKTENVLPCGRHQCRFDISPENRFCDFCTENKKNKL